MRKTIARVSNFALVLFSVLTFISSLAFSQLITVIFASLTLICAAIHFFEKYYSSISAHQHVNNRESDHKTLPNENANNDAEVDQAAIKEATTHRDVESGLFNAEFFPVFIEQRISAARRTLRPVSLVTFEIDGLDSKNIGSEKERSFFISSLGQVVTRTLRESDCAFRISKNTFAAVMDDTSEAGAVWAAERVRGVLHTGVLAGRVTVCAGVACYPSHALDANELIDTSNKALDNAKARGADQVEIATI